MQRTENSCSWFPREQWECREQRTVAAGFHQKQENSGSSENTSPGASGSAELFLRNCFPTWAEEVFPISSFGGRRLLGWDPFEELTHCHFTP